LKAVPAAPAAAIEVLIPTTSCVGDTANPTDTSADADNGVDAAGRHRLGLTAVCSEPTRSLLEELISASASTADDQASGSITCEDPADVEGERRVDGVEGGSCHDVPPIPHVAPVENLLTPSLPVSGYIVPLYVDGDNTTVSPRERLPSVRIESPSMIRTASMPAVVPVEVAVAIPDAHVQSILDQVELITCPHAGLPAIIVPDSTQVEISVAEFEQEDSTEGHSTPIEAKVFNMSTVYNSDEYFDFFMPDAIRTLRQTRFGRLCLLVLPCFTSHTFRAHPPSTFPNFIAGRMEIRMMVSMPVYFDDRHKHLLVT
jgi:hypothetical protein